MTKVQRLKEKIAKLSPGEMAQLPRWVAESDASLRDKHMEAEKETAAGDARPQDEIPDNP